MVIKKTTSGSSPLRARVYEPSRRAAKIAKGTATLLASLGRDEQREQANLKFRFAELLADNESGETVTIRFGEDTEDYPKPPEKWQTNEYGMIVGSLELSDSKVHELLNAQRSTNGWLGFRVSSSEHVGSGRVQIITPTCVSVISDNDDTIKITEVPGGKETLVKNTFFPNFRAVSERTLYLGLENAAFHYVSGSPWQLQKPLAGFLFDEQKFP
jgi:hypothetical protein